MRPLPPLLGNSGLIAWRLDNALFAQEWNRGEGAYLFGGRWNTKGSSVVYCAFEPANAILEVAVHKGFEARDRVPHTMTAIQITDPAQVHIVRPEDVPHPEWLLAGSTSLPQQEFGSFLLKDHVFVALPSAVSRHSWNLMFNPSRAEGAYTLLFQEPFALDPRLRPS
jgi:RES domain-containing protein